MFVLMTHNYNYDLAMLNQLLLRQVRYIGILGSRGKISRMIEELRAEKIDVDNQLSKIYSPVGLDLGAESPEEIALSIIAEIQAILSNGTGKHLGHQQTGNHSEIVKEIKEHV
jgi:xanthine/CO dehydrogenase XdhC/CoxF family maturation factor